MKLKEKKILIYSILAVLISSWLIGNLGNLEIDRGAEPLVLADFYSAIFFGVVLLAISLSVLYLVFISSRLKIEKRNVMNRLLFFGFWVFLFLGGVILVYVGFVEVGLFVDFLIPSGIGLSLGPLFIDMSIIIFLSLLGTLLGLYLYFNIKEKKLNESLVDIDPIEREALLQGDQKDDKNKEELEESLSSTLDKAISGLDKGDEVRSTIIRCYKEMSRLLEEKGAKNESFMTPREFKNQTIDEVPMFKKIISEITFLFEEARYSPHRLKEKDRDIVLSHLKKLKEET